MREHLPHLLVTGSRSIPLQNALEILRPIFEELDKRTVVVFGDAEGVDTAAYLLAKELRLGYFKVAPPWTAEGETAALRRNEWMVDLLPTGSRVVSVWDGRSGGTAHTIRYAEACGFRVEDAMLKSLFRPRRG